MIKDRTSFMIYLGKLKKKIRAFAPIIVTAILFVAMAGPIAGVAKASTLNIEVDKTVNSVECTEDEDGIVHNEISGQFIIENRSGIGERVVLTDVRDWVHSDGSLNQALMGDYSLTISDGNGFSWTRNYSIGDNDLTAGNPAFQSLNFGPIEDDETVRLNYTLDYTGILLDENRNSAEFLIANADNPEECNESAFRARSDEFCPAEECVVITPKPTVQPTASPTPVATITPTPVATITPEVAGVSEEVEVLPETGANWLGLLKDWVSI